MRLRRAPGLSGMAAFDAAWMGTPVVMTGYGGQLDFLDERYCRLVDYELIPVKTGGFMASYTADQRWAAPDLEDAIAALREMFEHLDRAVRNARELAARVRKRFSPAETVRGLREALGE